MLQQECKTSWQDALSSSGTVKFAPNGYDVVLGAGGNWIYMHFGFIAALIALDIPVNVFTGVSCGGWAAAMATNDHTPGQMFTNFRRARRLALNAKTWANVLTVPRLDMNGLTSMFTLEHLANQMVQELKVTSNDRYQLLAFDPVRRAPYLLRGKHYPVGQALAATGAIPDFIAPVEIDGRSLVDGGAFHFCPTQFSQAPAIVSSLGRGTGFYVPMTPVNGMALITGFLLRLVMNSNNYVDADRHVLVHSQANTPALADVGNQGARVMFREGFENGIRVLSEAINSGKISVRGK